MIVRFRLDLTFTSSRSTRDSASTERPHTDIPAGTAVRFEPGYERDVDLVDIGGDRIVHGMGGLVEGELDDKDVKARAMERARAQGYMEAR